MDALRIRGGKRLSGEWTVHSAKNAVLPIMAASILTGDRTVLEAVSYTHLIDMRRLDGVTFEAACYINFSQDHLDYFGTMENYFQTKKSFFLKGQVLNASLNADEETSEQIIDEIKIPYLTYGISAEADVFAREIEISENGVSFTIALRGLEEMEVSMHLTGMFNVYNALAAASLAMILSLIHI